MAVVKLKTGSGEEITIDDSKRLGKGGEGSVYSVQTPAKYSRYCIKEYSTAILADSKKMAERQAKVEYMAKNKVESANSGIVICWPVEAIFRNGRFVGFMMLKAFDQSKELEWFVSYNLMKVIKNTPFCSFDGSNGMTALYNRLVVANNLAHALHTIHSTNHYVLADTKPKNILITSTGNVSIVDLDSLQIIVDDQLKFKAPVASPNYKPPEGYDGRLNQEFDIIPISWDRFSYAVMAYELIIGSHPYGVGSYKSPYDQGEDTMYKIRTGLFLHGSKSPYLRTEHEASLATIRVRWNGLPDPLRQLFMTAFEKGQFKPEKRPTMQEWGKVLSDSITTLQGVLQKKPSAASSAVAAAGRQSASTVIAAARQSESTVKLPPMTTPTHTTIPSQLSSRPAHQVVPPTIQPPKQGLTTSDKVILSSIVFFGLFLWVASHVSSSSNHEQQSMPTPVYTQSYQQPVQQYTPVNDAAIDQSSDQAASDVTASQSEIQVASDVTASQSSAQTADVNATYPTSFDCSKAKSVSENLICHDAELATADSEMASIFQQAKAAATDKEEFTKRIRKQWNYREKNCSDKACVAAWYGYMKDILNKIARTGNADIESTYPLPPASQSEIQTATDKLPPTYPTSFDCSKAKSTSENLICHDAELAAADSEMVSIFHQAKAAATDKEAFTKWARKQWNYREKNCSDKACVAAWYGYMKEALNKIAQTVNVDSSGKNIDTTQQALAKYYIFLVNSVHSSDEADKQRASVLLTGLPADVRHTTSNGQEWYRVISGPYSKSEALKAQKKLQDSGIDALVVENNHLDQSTSARDRAMESF